MNSHTNLVLATLWILLSFIAGLALGLNFHREDWLGGYGSFKRRMYRLAHISLFALGTSNFIYYVIAKEFALSATVASVSSWGFFVGAITMPICCLVVASYPKARNIFAVPVVSLVTAGAITFWEVVTL